MHTSAPGTVGASGVSLSPFLLVGLSLHKLDFSLHQHVLHSDSMQSEKSHETKSSSSMKTNIQRCNTNQNVSFLQKSDKVWILRQNTDSERSAATDRHSNKRMKTHAHRTKALFWYSASFPTVTHYFCDPIPPPPSSFFLFLPLSAMVLWML